MENNKATILVVDDTPENIDVLVGTLKSEYNIMAATNGQMALNIVEAAQPDIILLDVMMPGMDGHEVCRHLKDNYKTRHIPVIFITAKSTVHDETIGLELGAVDYITKPISPPIVRSRVKTHLALHDQNRELDRKVRQKTFELHQTRLQVIQRLGRAAEYKDDDTGLHVIRMSKYSQVLALASGMNETDADLLQHAAPMHDIGKIGTPDHILKKPGKLDKDEFDVMKTHAEIGAMIIGEDDSDLMQVARAVALTHHEKWNGQGYPKGLKGEDIPFVGRVVAIADVFDALTSKRPYKEAWPVQKAVNLLQSEAGEHFDPKLIPLFVKELPKILGIKEEFDEK